MMNSKTADGTPLEGHGLANSLIWQLLRITRENFLALSANQFVCQRIGTLACHSDPRPLNGEDLPTLDAILSPFVEHDHLIFAGDGAFTTHIDDLPSTTQGGWLQGKVGIQLLLLR